MRNGVVLLVLFLTSLIPETTHTATQTTQHKPIGVSLTSFPSEIEERIFAFIYSEKICHLLCRANFFNSFVSDERAVETLHIDAISPRAMDTVSSRVLTIGTYWFKFRWESPHAERFADLFLAHEFGHLFYNDLPSEEKRRFRERAARLTNKKIALFSENRILEGYPFGHADDGNDELFASAFALRFVLPRDALASLDDGILNAVEPLVASLQANTPTMCSMWHVIF